MRLKIRKSVNHTPAKPSNVFGSEIRVDFPFQERPKFTDTLRFPDDITQLSAANISELLGKYTKLFAFANQNLATLNVGLLRLETEESMLRNLIFRSKPSIMHQDKWRRDAMLGEDPRVERIMQKRQRLLEQREILQMLLANFDKYLVALSRELSRKGFDREVTRNF